MENLFASLSRIKKDGYIPHALLAVCTNNEDPDNKRRIKVMLPQHGGKIESDWLYRFQAAPYLDQPLPETGQTVLVFYVEGNPHKGIYLGICTNAPNPPLDKMNKQKDYHHFVKGNIKIESAQHTITLSNGKASIIMHDNGHVEIDAVSLTVGGKEVITIGSIDTDGDTNITRGW
jgi:phage baseplate assembly protein gpV